MLILLVSSFLFILVALNSVVVLRAHPCQGLNEISDAIFPKPMTSTENLFNALAIGENTKLAYDEWENMLVDKFNWEEDMYGEVVPNEKVLNEMVQEFKEDIIPASKLKNVEFMDMIRSWR